MKKSILILMLLMTSSFCMAQNANLGRIVTVSTTANTKVKPNKFYLEIIVTDNLGAGKKGIEKTEKNTLIPTLKKHNIDIEKQLTYNDFESYFQKNKKIILSKSYQLILNDSEKVNDIILALEDENIGNVYLRKAIFVDTENVLDELKIKAVKKARHSAEVIASASEDKIGDMLQVRYYEYNQNLETTPMRGKMMGSANDENDYQPINFRNINLSVNLEIIFQLVD